MNNTKGCKEVGWYAVVHYGPFMTDARPLFLAKGWDCMFTANMERAQLFDVVGAAEAARDKAEKKLKEDWMDEGEPPLAGKLRVIRLFSQIVKKLEA